MAGKGYAVSDSGTTQNSYRDEKEENDARYGYGYAYGNGSGDGYGKNEPPKKKTTFKITSVTKSYQRGGSGGDLLSLETDLDSMDDQDETIDSHTEDLSSELYETNSRATDIDSHDPLLTPELMTEEIAKDSHPYNEIAKDSHPHNEIARDSHAHSEPRDNKPRFRVVKVETKEPFKRGRWVCCDFLNQHERSDDHHVHSSGVAGSVSLHYIHGVDDFSRNPLLAAASGTNSHKQPYSWYDDIHSDVFRPIQPAVSSHTGLRGVDGPNNNLNSYTGQVVQPSASMPYSVAGDNAGSRVGGAAMPVLPPMQQGETQTSQSLSGNIPFPTRTSNSQFQQLPLPQGSSHSQVVSMASITSPLQSQDLGGFQQPLLYQTSQQSAYSLSNEVLSNGPHQAYEGFLGEGMSLSSLRADGLPEPVPALGAGLAQIAVGGVTPPADSDMTEEAGSSTVAIDNKIEQAMDLAKRYLIQTVLKEVQDLMDAVSQLRHRIDVVELQNGFLKAHAYPDTLARLGYDGIAGLPYPDPLAIGDNLAHCSNHQ